MTRDKYNKEFQSFLEAVFKQDGVEGLANNLPFVDGALVITVDGNIVAANDAFLDLVCYQQSELYGQSIQKLIYQKDQQDVEKRIREKNQTNYHARLFTKDSTVKFVSVFPSIYEIDGVTYRLTACFDNTPVINLQKYHLNEFKKLARTLTNILEKRDSYTTGHMARTAAITVEIAKEMSLDKATIDTLWIGASIHDIGKISVPIEILTKPDKLNNFEWGFIKSHPTTGFEIVAEVDFNETIKQIILHHHESHDGSGYPDGTMGANIPLEVAIVSVADSLEAISGVRPYRKAFSFEEAIDIMNNQTGKYHNEVLKAASSLVKNGNLKGQEFGLLH